MQDRRHGVRNRGRFTVAEQFANRSFIHRSPGVDDRKIACPTYLWSVTRSARLIAMQREPLIEEQRLAELFERT
jgi:hypothetical protein